MTPLELRHPISIMTPTSLRYHISYHRSRAKYLEWKGKRPNDDKKYQPIIRLKINSEERVKGLQSIFPSIY